MPTSDRAFNQVRDILGRLDRSIDEARDRRLRGNEPQKPAEPQPLDTIVGTSDTGPEREPQRAPASAVAPRQTTRPPSPFGRAKPLRRD
jgi:hypothetical protein